MADKIEVACIGHPDLHAFLSEELPEWDWQVTAETIDDFINLLEDGGISAETRAIFIYDGLFDPYGDSTEFEEFIARFAPYAMIAVLNYDPSQNSTIQKAVSDSADANEWPAENFYFIDFQHPLRSIDNAVAKTIEEHGSDEVVEAFSRGKPVQSLMSFEEETDDSATDDKNGYDGPISTVSTNEKLGKVLSVTSSKGGSGKSTVAISLAGYIARASRQSKKEGLEAESLSVCIVDLDIRDGQLGFVTGKSQPTVLKIVLREEVSPETVREAAIWNEGLACDLYLAPKSGRASEETPPQFYNELIQTLRSMYDYIILDTSVNYLDPILEEVAYPSSDQIIFVTDLGISSVFGMTRWLKEVTGKGLTAEDSDLASNKINENKIGIVVNKTMPGVGMTPEKVKRAAMGRPVLSNLPSMPTMVTAAANSKRIQDLTKNKEFNQYMRMLSRAVIGKSYKLAHID